MKYPVLVHKTNRNTVIAICPLMKGFFAEAEKMDDALKQLRDKFLCFLHDPDIQFEIIPVGSKIEKKEGVYDAGKNT